MRKALICLMLLTLPLWLLAQQSPAPGQVVCMGEGILLPLQERDSVLIADQLIYGFELYDVEEGTQFAFPVLKDTLMTGVEIVEQWKMDTLKVNRGRKGRPGSLDLRGGIRITSFDEATYILPPLAVQRLSSDGVLDTLVFDPQRLEVRGMPVDTATFTPHDIKGQIRYPVTFAELLPWFALALALAAVVVLIVWLVRRWRRTHDPEYIRKDPPHIVALRKLDKYRGNKFWAPERQKEFYSGITDTLREYIAARYGIGAMEMTTAEIFAAMKDVETQGLLLSDVKELFERADFVKFAKFTMSEEDNAAVLPLAVRFVTSTYQADVEDESARTDVSDDKEKEVSDVL